jgi:hypothetical protein
MIPADRKWMRNLAVSSIMVEALEKMKLKWPRPTIDPSKIVIP